MKVGESLTVTRGDCLLVVKGRVVTPMSEGKETKRRGENEYLLNPVLGQILV